MGHHARRCGPGVSQYERVGAPRGPGPDRYFARHPEPAPDPRQLRSPGRRQRRPQHRLAGPAEPRHQPRLSDRHRSRRWIAGPVHLGLRAARLSRRSPAGRRSTATCSSPSPRPTSSAGSSSRTTATAIRARKAYQRGEFLASTDERFRPVFLSNAPDGTIYIADMYRGIIEHRISITEVPPRPDPRPPARAADRARPHLPRRPRHDASATRSRRPVEAATNGAAGRDARRTRTAGGATRRSA